EVSTDQLERNLVALRVRKRYSGKIQNAVSLVQCGVQLLFERTRKLPQGYRCVIFIFIDPALLPELVLLVRVQAEHAHEDSGEDYQNDRHTRSSQIDWFSLV